MDVRLAMEWEERRKVEHFRIRYEFNGEEHACRVDGKDARDAKKQALKDKGAKIISCRKLYPFSTEKNQHNFELIRNICMNRIYDMDSGDIPYDAEEMKRLYEIKAKADKYWCLPLPVAWLEWEEYEEARELVVGAREHRANACIENGRPDLVKYC